MIKSNTYKELSPEELHRWIKEEKNFYLIDTLNLDNFSRRHLPNALDACVFEMTFIDQIKAITDDKNSEIVLYGASNRSSDAITAAEKLEQNGYSYIYVLKGGIEAWCSAGLPLEGTGVDEPSDPQTLLKLEDRSYRVDVDHSIIEWRGRNPNTAHFGTIRIVSGELVAKDGIFTGMFDIDMDSITNINLEGDELQPILITHLKSDDFFLTKLFPRARFKINKAIPVKEPFVSLPNYEINGTLELRGVKAQQDFMATVAKTAENNLVAEAHFDIDRTKWGVIYGSARFFEYLGMHMVFDLISFQVRIVAN
jgi:rhodanese-related sulfurtransferase/polyisoprenoid-binding protein YceI